MTKKALILKISLIQALLFCMVSAGLKGQNNNFFLEIEEPKVAEIPPFVEKEKTENDISAIVSFEGQSVNGSIPPTLFGQNLTPWCADLVKDSMALLDIKNLSPGILRWPADSIADLYFWNREGTDRPADLPNTIVNWYAGDHSNGELSLQEYYRLLDKTGMQGIITVNYAYARYGTGENPVSTAAHMAADWVRYDSGRTKYWEIGNENYGYWEPGFLIDQAVNQDGQAEEINGELYGQHCLVFIDSMKAAAAERSVEIKIGVTLFEHESSSFYVQASWNERLLPVIHNMIDFASVHFDYSYLDYGIQKELGPFSHMYTDFVLSEVWEDIMDAGIDSLPLAFDKWNCFSADPLDELSFRNGLHAVLVLGRLINNQVGMAAYWPLFRHADASSKLSVFSPGEEDGVRNFKPLPVFYYLYYMQKYLGNNLLSSESNDKNIIALASSFSSGEYGLVVVNTDSIFRTVSLYNYLQGYGGKYYYYILSPGSDDITLSRKVNINGVETEDEGGGPDNYASIDAFASPVYGGIKLDIPSQSVAFVLIENNVPFSYVTSFTEKAPNMISIVLSENIILPETTDGLIVSCNGTELPVDHFELDPEDSSILNIYFSYLLNNFDVIKISYSGNNILATDNTPLASFSDETVTNRLTGTYINVNVIVKSASTLKPLSASAVTLNSETLFSDIDGEAGFVTLSGLQDLTVSRRFYETAHFQDINVFHDTTITVLLDSADYTVSFFIGDPNYEVGIPGVLIHVNNDAVLTGEDGKASYTGKGGLCLMHFEKEGSIDSTFYMIVESDTMVNMYFNILTADLQFITLYKDTRLEAAYVYLNDWVRTTNVAGECVFNDLPAGTAYTYSVEKTYFNSEMGSLYLKRDTSIYINMEKYATFVQFRVLTDGEDPVGGYVQINEDVVYLNEFQFAVFPELPINMEYDYTVHTSNFPEYLGSFFLTDSLFIEVTLTKTGVNVENGRPDIQIFPNPGNGRFTVTSTEPVEYLELSDLSGKILYRSTVEPGEFTFDAGLELKAGVYLVRLGFTDCLVVRKLVVKE